MRRFHLTITAATLGVAALLGGATARADDSTKAKDGDRHRIVTNDKGDRDARISEGEVTTDPARILRGMHFMAQYDIRASQLALERSTSKGVHKFAKDVIEDWTKFDKETVETSSKLGVALGPPVELPASAPKAEETTTPSGTLTTPRGDVIPGGSGASGAEANRGLERTGSFENEQQQEAIKKLERLQTLSGFEFDREYLSLMSACADRSRTALSATHKALEAKDDDVSEKVDDLVEDAIDNAKDHGEDAKDVIKDMK